jgi:hypothetical protein
MLPEPDCYLTIDKYVDLIENKKPILFHKKVWIQSQHIVNSIINAENNTSK